MDKIKPFLNLVLIHKVGIITFALCGEELKIERNGNKNDQHLYSFSGCEI